MEWPTLVEARRATYAATRVRTALGHFHAHTPLLTSPLPSLAGEGEGEGKGQAADAKADAQPDVDAITTALSGKLEL